MIPAVQGQSLRDCRDSPWPLPIADAVRIASEVAGALDHAHRVGIIHRNINPKKIMLHCGTCRWPTSGSGGLSAMHRATPLPHKTAEGVQRTLAL